MCLLSPQSIAQQTQNADDGFHIQPNKSILTFTGFKKTVFYNKANNLPILFTATDLSSPPPIPNHIPSTTAALLTSIDFTDNLSTLQWKLLQKHFQMGHLHMTQIQELAHKGFLGNSNSKLATCDPPLCKACLHSKQHWKPLNSSDFHPIDSSYLTPGDCIFEDQLKNTHPALTLQWFPLTKALRQHLHSMREL